MTTKVAEQGNRSEGSRRLAVAIPLSALDEEPLVSILVANFNYGRFLPETVDCLLSQAYRNWELLICDDGSTDASREILLELEQRDPRIKPLHKENGGQASAWNLAYAHAMGDIICLLDADDWFKPEKLSTVIAAFRANSAAGVVYHRYQPADEKGLPIDLPPLPHELPSGWLADIAFEQGGHVFVSKTSDLALRREVASQIFPLPESLRGYGDAYIGRVLPFMTEIAAVPDALSYYRLHQQNHSGWSAQVSASASRVIVQSELIVFDHLQRFLTERLGSDVAKQVHLSDVRMLWDQMAALFILNGKPEEGVMGYRPDQIYEQLTRTRRKYIWKALFTLPSPISIRLLNLWWARTWWKQYTRGVTRRLGIGDWAS